MMPELKILGKIELPEKKVRPEEYRWLLEKRLSDISHETNAQFGYDLLDSKAAIKMTDSPDFSSDQIFVSELEASWAREQHKTVEEWHRSRDKNPTSITEMAVTISLHRLLSERFIVARACAYDDYRNHVDNVLIDKETGAVVCGFDEVLGYEGDDGGEKKEEKIKKILAKGGSSLKYGATIEDGKIVRHELKNIPTFYLSLSKVELDNLLKDLKAASAVPTANEKNLGLKMLESLGRQYEEAKGLANNPSLQENLLNFAASLGVIKEQLDKN